MKSIRRVNTLENIVEGYKISKNLILKFECDLREESQGCFGGLDGKESACNAGDPVPLIDQEEIPEKGMATHSSILEHYS